MELLAVASFLVGVIALIVAIVYGRIQAKAAKVTLAEYVQNKGTIRTTTPQGESPPQLSPIADAIRSEHNLPSPLSSFIGREQEVAEICRLILLDELRLITLVGPGGSGKTRIAIQVAWQVLGHFAGQVFFTDLSSIRDPSLVIPSIAARLGVPAMHGLSLLDSTKDYLRGKHLLMILDNFEQVVSSAPQIADLLTSSPELTVLVTSREVLGISGEYVFEVLPLSTPDTLRHTSLSHIKQTEAVQLFVERARQTKRDFILTESNAATVASICSRLDGLPLAIELAASQLKIYSEKELQERLNDRFQLLSRGKRDAPPRQHSLRATIDWSLELLTLDERTLFEKLAIFAGGFSLEAAQTVCAINNHDPETVSRILEALVGKSLVQQRRDLIGRQRFFMLETIKEYAVSMLIKRSDFSGTQEAHARYFLSIVQRSEPEIHTRERKNWMLIFEIELDNLRNAFTWASTESDKTIALLLAAGLWSFWLYKTYLLEGCMWLDRILELTEESSTSARAKALARAGDIARRQFDFEAAYSLCHQSLEMATRFDDIHTVAFSLLVLSHVHLNKGSSKEAENVCRRALTLFERTGDTVWIAWSLFDLGSALMTQEKLDVALHAFRRSMGLFLQLDNQDGKFWVFLRVGDVEFLRAQYNRALHNYRNAATISNEMGDMVGQAYAQLGIGRTALQGNDRLLALEHFVRALVLSRDVNHKQCVAECLEGLAAVATGNKEGKRAALLLGAASKIRQAMSSTPASIALLIRRQASVDVKTLIPDNEYRDALLVGNEMSMEQAIAFALGD